MIDDLLLKMRFKQKGILLVAIPLVFELLFVTVLSLAYVRAENDSAIAGHGRRVLVLIDGMTSGLFAWGAAIILSKNVSSEKLEQRSQSVLATLGELSEELTIETRGYPVEAGMVEEMMKSFKALNPREESYRQLMSNRFSMSKGALRQSGNVAREHLTTLAKSLDDLVTYEQSTAMPHAAHAAQSRQLLNLIWFGGIATNVALSIWIALVFGNQITSRLQVVGRNAGRLSRAETLTESLRGADELSDLDQQMQVLAMKAIETSLRERAMIDNTADMILALAPDLTITAANAAAPRVVGWNVSNLIDLPSLALILAEEREKFMQAFRDCRSTKEIRNLDFLLLKNDGSVLESRWSVLWSESEQSFFCLVRDISSEKRAEKLRQKFFAMVTHDLRSPLASLYTFMEQLANEKYGQLDSSGQKTLARVSENLLFLTDLTNDLLDLGRMQSGTITLSVSTFPAEVLVDEACGVIESAASAKSIRLNVSIADSLTLYGDFSRLKQVLVNLMSNAIKFSPPSGVMTIRMEREGAFTKVNIQDEGPGLPDEDIARVFDSYIQADNQEQATAKGYGLGLSIVKSIIDAHGGLVGAENIDGGGTQFWFTLPDQADNAS